MPDYANKSQICDDYSERENSHDCAELFHVSGALFLSMADWEGLVEFQASADSVCKGGEFDAGPFEGLLKRSDLNGTYVQDGNSQSPKWIQRENPKATFEWKKVTTKNHSWHVFDFAEEVTTFVWSTPDYGPVATMDPNDMFAGIRHGGTMGEYDWTHHVPNNVYQRAWFVLGLWFREKGLKAQEYFQDAMWAFGRGTVFDNAQGDFVDSGFNKAHPWFPGFQSEEEYKSFLTQRFGDAIGPAGALTVDDVSEEASNWEMRNCQNKAQMYTMREIHVAMGMPDLDKIIERGMTKYKKIIPDADSPEVSLQLFYGSGTGMPGSGLGGGGLGGGLGGGMGGGMGETVEPADPVDNVADFCALECMKQLHEYWAEKMETTASSDYNGFPYQEDPRNKIPHKADGSAIADFESACPARQFWRSWQMKEDIQSEHGTQSELVPYVDSVHGPGILFFNHAHMHSFFSSELQAASEKVILEDIETWKSAGFYPKAPWDYLHQVGVNFWKCGKNMLELMPTGEDSDSDEPLECACPYVSNYEIIKTTDCRYASGPRAPLGKFETLAGYGFTGKNLYNPMSRGSRQLGRGGINQSVISSPIAITGGFHCPPDLPSCSNSSLIGMFTGPWGVMYQPGYSKACPPTSSNNQNAYLWVKLKISKSLNNLKELTGVLVHPIPYIYDTDPTITSAVDGVAKYLKHTVSINSTAKTASLTATYDLADGNGEQKETTTIDFSTHPSVGSAPDKIELYGKEEVESGFPPYPPRDESLTSWSNATKPGSYEPEGTEYPAKVDKEFKICNYSDNRDGGESSNVLKSIGAVPYILANVSQDNDCEYRVSLAGDPTDAQSNSVALPYFAVDTSTSLGFKSYAIIKGGAWASNEGEDLTEFWNTDGSEVTNIDGGKQAHYEQLYGHAVSWTSHSFEYHPLFGKAILDGGATSQESYWKNTSPQGPRFLGQGSMEGQSTNFPNPDDNPKCTIEAISIPQTKSGSKEATYGHTPATLTNKDIVVLINPPSQAPDLPKDCQTLKRPTKSPQSYGKHIGDDSKSPPIKKYAEATKEPAYKLRLGQAINESLIGNEPSQGAWSNKASVVITCHADIATNQNVVLISTDGTSKTYTAKTANAFAVNQFKADVDAATTATNLKAAIEDATNGHGDKFTVTLNGAALTIVQATAGSAGNKAIAKTFDTSATFKTIDGADATTFTGGLTEKDISNFSSTNGIQQIKQHKLNQAVLDKETGEYTLVNSTKYSNAGSDLSEIEPIYKQTYDTAFGTSVEMFCDKVYGLWLAVGAPCSIPSSGKEGQSAPPLTSHGSAGKGYKDGKFAKVYGYQSLQPYTENEPKILTVYNVGPRDGNNALQADGTSAMDSDLLDDDNKELKRLTSGEKYGTNGCIVVVEIERKKQEDEDAKQATLAKYFNFKAYSEAGKRTKNALELMTKFRSDLRKFLAGETPSDNRVSLGKQEIVIPEGYAHQISVSDVYSSSHSFTSNNGVGRQRQRHEPTGESMSAGQHPEKITFNPDESSAYTLSGASNSENNSTATSDSEYQADNVTARTPTYRRGNFDLVPYTRNNLSSTYNHYRLIYNHGGGGTDANTVLARTLPSIRFSRDSWNGASSGVECDGNNTSPLNPTACNGRAPWTGLTVTITAYPENDGGPDKKQSAHKGKQCFKKGLHEVFAAKWQLNKKQVSWGRNDKGSVWRTHSFTKKIAHINFTGNTPSEQLSGVNHSDNPDYGTGSDKIPANSDDWIIQKADFGSQPELSESGFVSFIDVDGNYWSLPAELAQRPPDEDEDRLGGGSKGSVPTKYIVYSDDGYKWELSFDEVSIQSAKFFGASGGFTDGNMTVNDLDPVIRNEIHMVMNGTIMNPSFANKWHTGSCDTGSGRLGTGTGGGTSYGEGGPFKHNKTDRYDLTSDSVAQKNELSILVNTDKMPTGENAWDRVVRVAVVTPEFTKIDADASGVDEIIDQQDGTTILLGDSIQEYFKVMIQSGMGEIGDILSPYAGGKKMVAVKAQSMIDARESEDSIKALILQHAAVSRGSNGTGDNAGSDYGGAGTNNEIGPDAAPNRQEGIPGFVSIFNFDIENNNWVYRQTIGGPANGLKEVTIHDNDASGDATIKNNLIRLFDTDFATEPDSWQLYYKAALDTSVHGVVGNVKNRRGVGNTETSGYVSSKGLFGISMRWEKVSDADILLTVDEPMAKGYVNKISSLGATIPVLLRERLKRKHTFRLDVSAVFDTTRDILEYGHQADGGPSVPAQPLGNTRFGPLSDLINNYTDNDAARDGMMENGRDNEGNGSDESTEGSEGGLEDILIELPGGMLDGMMNGVQIEADSSGTHNPFLN